jgi:glycosyltransferase involved in cell wall biosynthesis
MTYIIIGDSFTFPDGDAATNRVFTYAKGFVENGVNVYVVGFRNDYLSVNEGEIKGIRYVHPFNRKARHRNFFVRRWQKITKYFSTIRLLREIGRQDNIEQMTVYSTRFMTHLFAWYLTRLFKAKLIKECSEHPLRLHQGNYFRKTFGFIKFKSEACLCDGIICISRFLMDFHRREGIPEPKLLLVPSTVDPSRFEGTSDNPLPYRYIGYFGALTFKRDNVDLLMKAFQPLSEKFPDYHLVIGGPGTQNERKLLTDLAQELRITSKFTLLDYMPREEITKYIKGADILVMVRGKDMESDASFPSKLTEYLAASRPLITVNVGEIPDYLTDGINTFLIPPGNYLALTRKIEDVINDYESAVSIAHMGKELTNTVFNYSFQARRIISFVGSL